MPHYSVIVVKNNKYDIKNSCRASSKPELEARFEALKEKFNAVEKPEMQTSMGAIGTQGFFKLALGQSKGGKQVEIQYNEISGKVHK